MPIETNLLEIDLTKINLPPHSVKRKYNPTLLTRDIERARVNNLIAPLVVRRLEDGKFELVAGYRRLFVARQAGMSKVTCVVCIDTPEAVTAMQTLDWLHDVGEHVILRHPDAYRFYLEKKAALLKRELPPELETDQAWENFIRVSLKAALQAMLLWLWGNEQVAIVNELINSFEEYGEYDHAMNDLVDLICAEEFKVKELEQHAAKLINLIVTLSNLEAREDLNWVNDLTINLEAPALMNIPLNLNDASQIFTLSPLNLTIYKRCLRSILYSQQNNYFVTQKGKIKKRFGKQQVALTDNGNYQFSRQLLSALVDLLREYPQQTSTIIFNDEDFANICYTDFQSRLNVQLQRLYDKIRRDEKIVTIDRNYIEACFDELNIVSTIFLPMQLTVNEQAIYALVTPSIKILFVNKIEQAMSAKNRVHYSLNSAAYRIKNDVGIRTELTRIFKNKLLEKRDSLEIHYNFADSQLLKANSSAELLGTLLLMQRSYKHFIKQRLSEKNIFFKKRMKFNTIEDYLGKDRALELADGISEFIFMIELNGLGTVTTELKIFGTPNFNYHVQQFQSYRKKLTKGEKEALENPEEDAKKSSFYEMAAAMTAKGKPVPKGAEIDQTIAKWMGNVLKLLPPEMTAWPKHVQDDALRLFRVYVFVMFYIEGLRNPGAFVIHPLVLKRLIDQPLQQLEQYIVNGEFIMTPLGATEEGRTLHQTLQPSDYVKPISFQTDIGKFVLQGMANREVNIIKAEIEKNPDIEEQVLTLFNLSK